MISATGAELLHIKGDKNIVPDFLSSYKAPKRQVAIIGPHNAIPYMDRIKQHQEEDQFLQEVKTAIAKEQEIYHHYYRSIRNKLQIIDDLLYVMEEDRSVPVIPMKDGVQFVREVHHNDYFNAHMSADKMEKVIARIAHVKNLPNTCRYIYNKCGKCLQNRSLRGTSIRAPIHKPGDRPDGTGEHWHLDHFGPLSLKEGKRYIWKATDAFSKFSVMGLAREHTARSAFTFLKDRVIMKYGVPAKVTSDGGTDFASKVIDKLHNALGIERIITCTYNPKANSNAERGWRRLKSYFKKEH